MPNLRALVLGAATLLVCGRAAAQSTPPAAPPPVPATQAQPTRLFLDCSGFYCDLDYYQREIPFVDWVRDRADADVHLLVVHESTGGGGGEYTLTFIGQRRFQG